MHHLFWTGGWDSTFRLLQILLDKKHEVQTYYIVSSGISAGCEIMTMNQIRGYLFDTYPETRVLLKPIKIYDFRMIASNKEIHQAYIDTKKKYPIRLQYETFARFCDQFNIESMELSVLKNETVDFPLTNKYIFSYFSYPLMGYTKKQMAEIAYEKGWNDVMSMTWFCRRPRNGNPCGFCGPCTDVALAGMSGRLPFRARVIAKLQLPFRKFWRDNYQLQSNPLFSKIQQLLKGKY